VNSVGGPVFSLTDGVIVSNGAKLVISSPQTSNVEIIYTTNGQDPRYARLIVLFVYLFISLFNLLFNLFDYFFIVFVCLFC
jgi:hypothetical protein